MNNGSKIQSIDRAIQVLKCFSEQKKELKLTEIADEIGLSKSTVHGIVSSLKYHGLLDQDEATQKYSLGLYLMVLGETVSKSLNIRNITSPVIQDVCNIVNETVHIGKLDGSDVIYVDKIESMQSMRIFTNIGAKNPSYCTGVGKSMLAYLDEETVLSLFPDKLESKTTNTITDKSELIKELKKIRENGYCLDNEEYVEGLICVAAPIFDYSGKIKYAISVSGPTVRMTEDKIYETIEVVKNAAKKISYKLHFKE